MTDEAINWSTMIFTIKRHLQVSYRVIGEKVGLSGSEIAKIARGEADYEPRYTPGRKLIELEEKAKAI
ncbi:hypothetical protein [Crenobacter cavernae]|uniref:XRE family transcriptional regulator n=1 Tax=Crenobacter cavernae TaxID=2290923 RepID=A0ABY0FAI3_9NEIS|nr:hypothetical protein [Crenobacter cavernae]RXZ42662.1 hypothetical protein EBB06_12260 [Crenobacter cavernae]